MACLGGGTAQGSQDFLPFKGLDTELSFVWLLSVRPHLSSPERHSDGVTVD